MDQNDPITAFENRLPDDTFWAAKQVMAFTDEEIRAIVQHRRVQPAGRGLDHRDADRTPQSDRTDVFSSASCRSIDSA